MAAVASLHCSVWLIAFPNLSRASHQHIRTNPSGHPVALERGPLHINKLPYRAYILPALIYHPWNPPQTFSLSLVYEHWPDVIYNPFLSSVGLAFSELVHAKVLPP